MAHTKSAPIVSHLWGCEVPTPQVKYSYRIHFDWRFKTAVTTVKYGKYSWNIVEAAAVSVLPISSSSLAKTISYVCLKVAGRYVWQSHNKAEKCSSVS